MSTWYSLNIGHSADAEEPTRQVQNAVMAAHITAFRDPEIALFSTHNLEDMTVTLYFSPKADPIAQSFGASPCSRPQRDDRLGLLCCDPRAWDALFSHTTT